MFLIVMGSLPVLQPLPYKLNVLAVMFLQPAQRQRCLEVPRPAIAQGNSGLDVLAVNQLYPVFLARIPADDFKYSCCVGLGEILSDNFQQGFLSYGPLWLRLVLV